MSTQASASTDIAPVWFISHGGPPTMFSYDHPAYKSWSDLGQQILAWHDNGKGPLKALVIISAHWQSEVPGVVQVNIDETNPLVYDYFNFPSHFYDVKVQSHNPPSLSHLVLDELNKSFAASKTKLRAEPTRRGLDHGAFVPLKVAFYPAGEPLPKAGEAGPVTTLPSTLPVVQVTLPPTDDAKSSLLLGQAQRNLRTKGVGIFSGGMGVHNLRESIVFRSMGDKAPKVPYESFTEDVVRAVSLQPAASAEAEDPRWQAIIDLTSHKLYKGAHPSDEHFNPIPVAVGATFPNEMLYSTLEKKEGAMGWNMFGRLPKPFAKV